MSMSTSSISAARNKIPVIALRVVTILLMRGRDGASALARHRLSGGKNPLKRAPSQEDLKDGLMNIFPGNLRFGAGQPVKRLEDQRLLTGKGQFIDDKPEDGALWLHVLRSPHA